MKNSCSSFRTNYSFSDKGINIWPSNRSCVGTIYDERNKFLKWNPKSEGVSVIEGERELASFPFEKFFIGIHDYQILNINLPKQTPNEVTYISIPEGVDFLIVYPIWTESTVRNQNLWWLKMRLIKKGNDNQDFIDGIPVPTPIPNPPTPFIPLSKVNGCACNDCCSDKDKRSSYTNEDSQLESYLKENSIHRIWVSDIPANKFDRLSLSNSISGEAISVNVLMVNSK